MVRLHFIPLLVVGCLLVHGCELFGSSTDEPDRTLTEVGWILRSVEDAQGRSVWSPKAGETYRIEFDIDGKGQGVDACNWCGVAYEFGGDEAISIGMGPCTEVACSPPSFGYSTFVSRVTSYTIQGGRLRLRTINFEGEEITLVHQAWEKGDF